MLDWVKRKLGILRSRPGGAGEAKARPTSFRLGPGDLFRTYTGLLDDVMLRYSADYAGEEFFNKIIAKNILFGGGVYMNDGYLVNHPVARQYLRDEHSLLRVMMREANFVRILTRASNPDALARMPRKMADDGNQSFQRLVNSSEWADFEPQYEELAQGLFHSGNARGWPNYDMSVGYRKLMGRVLNATPDDLGLDVVTEDQLKWIREAFYERKPEEGNPRDKFEKAVLHVVKNPGAKATRAAMEIANQAYHYNFGLMLTAEEDNGVAVDTTVGMAFDELLATRRVERGQIDDIRLVKVPRNLPLEDGEMYRGFCDPTTSVGKAKFEYMHVLRDLLAAEGREIADLRSDVREATRAYQDRIDGLVKTHYGTVDLEWDDGDDGMSFTQAISPKRWFRAGKAVATASPNAWLTLVLQGNSKNSRRRLLMDRFRIEDATEEFSLKPHESVRLGDIRPQIASLAFDEDKAAEFRHDIKPFA